MPVQTANDIPEIPAENDDAQLGGLNVVEEAAEGTEVVAMLIGGLIPDDARGLTNELGTLRSHAQAAGTVLVEGIKWEGKPARVRHT